MASSNIKKFKSATIVVGDVQGNCCFTLDPTRQVQNFKPTTITIGN
jgi:hypothetical protein